MSKPFPPIEAVEHRRFYYGWVIVAVTTLFIAITYGLMYSYGVLLKPLAEYFSWDRSTVSAVYSISLIIRGAISIGVGWLADRYGAARLIFVCGFMLGLGLFLSSRVTELWQLYLTYGIIVALGMSGAFGIGTALVSRWFMAKRGLAMGIVSTGAGMGTLFVVPGVERLVNTYGWSQALVICGAAAGVIMMSLVFLLRPAPPPALTAIRTRTVGTGTGGATRGPSDEPTISEVMRNPLMLLFIGSLMLFFFSIQMIMVHLVSYATDTGISPLVAATFISIVGAVSIGGRMLTGVATDKTGIFNTLVFTRLFLAVSFIFLLFTRYLWSFYLFAVVFGVPYGGEIPQIPIFVGRYWGTKSMATLVGLTTFFISIGGALGSWSAGKIFDITENYRVAFMAGGTAAVLSLLLILATKWRGISPEDRLQ